MSYDNLSSVSQNVLKFDQQLTGEERRIPCETSIPPYNFVAGGIIKQKQYILLLSRLKSKKKCSNKNDSRENIYLHLNHKS
jgi:hypothetical protein